MTGRVVSTASESDLSRTELVELYAQYAEYLDEGPLDQWPSLFSDEAEYRVVTRENHERGLPLAMILCEGRGAIEDRVYAIEHTAFALPRRTRHLTSGIRARPHPIETDTSEHWIVTANFAVFETLEGRHTQCHSTGRYQDRIARNPEGALVFVSKLAICDAALVPNSLVIPL